jgi:ABC-type cobalamin/Fe3+-siderophores transport system ATPase subunit
MAGNREPIIQFNDVSFFYVVDPELMGEDSQKAVEDPAAVKQVFTGLSLDCPPGVVSLVGENGVGKSTFLLLAGARLFPTAGEVKLLGKTTRYFEDAPDSAEKEEERNGYVSFVYQNMEFETEEPVGALMEYIYENGFHEEKDPSFLRDVTEVMELSGILDKQTQKLSKGQLQRAILGFSLLYGSRIIMLDEPVFALEEGQKDKIFSFLMDFVGKTGTSVYYSAHNLDLTQKYSDYMVLIYKDGTVRIGKTEELYRRDLIEEVFKVPLAMMHRREQLFREHLLHESRFIRGDDPYGS